MNKKLLIVDRFEGDWAVIEYGDVNFNLPKTLVPEHIQEGDVLTLDIRKDDLATEQRKKEVEDLVRRLFVDE